MSALVKSRTQGEYNVVWWDPEDQYYYEKRWCSAEEAVETAVSLVNRPAAGWIIKRIMVTDGGDDCVFDWNAREGVVWGGSQTPLEGRPVRDWYGAEGWPGRPKKRTTGASRAPKNES